MDFRKFSGCFLGVDSRIEIKGAFSFLFVNGFKSELRTLIRKNKLKYGVFNLEYIQ